MVTLEALMNAGMSEEEARHILEIFNGETDENEESEPPMAETAEETESAEAEEPAAGESADEAESSAETEDSSGESPADESAVTEEAAETEEPDSEPPAVNPLAEENAALRTRVVESGLRAGALAAGVKPDRLEALFRLADTSGIDPMAADAQEQIDAAVQRALSLVPELAMTAPAVTTGSAGMHPREPVNQTDPFSRGFRG